MTKRSAIYRHSLDAARGMIEAARYSRRRGTRQALFFYLNEAAEWRRLALGEAR